MNIQEYIFTLVNKISTSGHKRVKLFNVSKVTSSDMGDNTFEYKLVITEIKQYHNGPGHLFAENILADITCPFTIFVDSSGTVLDSPWYISSLTSGRVHGLLRTIEIDKNLFRG